LITSYSRKTSRSQDGQEAARRAYNNFTMPCVEQEPRYVRPTWSKYQLIRNRAAFTNKELLFLGRGRFSRFFYQLYSVCQYL